MSSSAISATSISDSASRTTSGAPECACTGTPAYIERPVAAMGSWATAVLLMVAGAVQVLEGISALRAGEVIVGQEYIYRWNASGWGAVHIVVGAPLTAAAWFIGRAWVRVAAIVLAASSIVVNFVWLPYNPWWSILIIALDAFLIWALATWHHEPEIPTDDKT
jgi:hypothetical protein